MRIDTFSIAHEKSSEKAFFFKGKNKEHPIIKILCASYYT